jgi:exosortase B
MSAVLEHRSIATIRSERLRWLPLFAGLAALYLPTYIALANGAWNDEQNAHGPIVLAMVAWLLFRCRSALSSLPEKGSLLAGGLVFAMGLVLFFLGRAVDVIYFETFSQIPVIAGLLLVIYGRRGLAITWFVLLYMLFLVPLPGVVIDAATGPLKHLVSAIAEQVLYHAGYPIARNGVVLTIGQYQLLVADACSGLNSMYSLSAMGLLFLYMMGGGWIRMILLAICILPIAFVANILRVLVLVLVTYYLGDEAGQGFLHGFSGILLFVISMLMLFALHALLARAFPRPSVNAV